MPSTARSLKRNHFITFLLVAVPPVCAILAYIIATTRQAHGIPTTGLVAIIAAAVTYGIQATKFIIDRVDSAYLASRRLWRWMVNSEVLWRFKAGFTLPSGASTEAAIEQARQAFLSRADGIKVEIVVSDPHKSVLIFGAVTVELVALGAVNPNFGSVIDEEPDGTVIEIKVRQCQTPYRATRRLYSRHFAPVMETIARVISSPKQTYDAAFEFTEETNPFLGPMLKRVDPTTGHFEYSEKVNAETRVKLTGNALKVSTRNASDLRAQFDRFLALSFAPTPRG